MTTAGKMAIEKLKIIMGMASNHEVKELAKVMIEYVEAVEKSGSSVGFGGTNDKKK